MSGRTLEGVTLYDRTQAYRGFTFFITSGSPRNRDAWLIDMEGRIVHRWHMPHWPMNGVLLPNGNLLYSSRMRKGPVAHMPGAAGYLQEVDWEGNVVWQHEEPHMHHDFLRLQNGNTLLAKYVPVPDEIVARVKGGIPKSEWYGRDGESDKPIMWGDAYQEINPKGKVIWEWRDYEHLDPETDEIEPRAPRRGWAITNSFFELSDGNILVSWVVLDTVAILDKATGDIKWRYGPTKEAWWRNPISFQHNPSMLPNGNILLFDNGRHRILPPWYHPPDFSRIIEIDPNNDEVVWEYKDKNVQDFFSPFMSGCERLQNNNTLVCEASHGRIFEVTYDKEMVWEYVSPFYGLHPSPHFGVTNMMFRAHRYGPDYPGLQGKDLDPTRYETWNRLYCPEAYSAVVKRSWRVIEVPSATKKKKPVPSPAPVQNVEAPSSDEEWAVEERLEYLGY